jgi:uncharacterized membrane protein (UPF0127 family)
MNGGLPGKVFIAENLTQQCVIASQIQAANTSAARRRGLLEVRELDPDSGLWIDPCEAVHTFGMQIELDVVFLDSRLRVKKIAAHLKPNRIAFCLTATSVLEIRAGMAGSSGLKCGDQLSLREGKQPIALSGSGR